MLPQSRLLVQTKVLLLEMKVVIQWKFDNSKSISKGVEYEHLIK